MESVPVAAKGGLKLEWPSPGGREGHGRRREGRSHRLVYKDSVRSSVVENAPATVARTIRRGDCTMLSLTLPIAAVLIVVPFVIAVISLVGSHWYPSSDLALEAVRIKDVGGHHTPLVGVQSRLGWDHPGPLMFWLLAPFHGLFGQTGLLLGAAVLNAAALVGSLIVARRRGGLPLVALVAIVAALLCRALGPELLIDPWNPWVPVLPFLLYAMLAWCVADQDWVALPWLVGIGSFVVQTHVGYAPEVLGLGALACALGAFGSYWEHRRARAGGSGDTQPPPSARRWIVVAAAVGFLVWLGPVVQQLTGSPGNLGEIVDSFRHPVDPVAGWEAGFGVMGRELALVGPWITGNDAAPSALVGTASTIPATLLLVATAALGALAWRRGANDAGRLALLAVSGAGIGVVAVSRITGFLGPYLVRWSWVIAALVWLSLVWSLWSLVARAPMTNALAAVSLVTVVGLTVSTGWSAVSVPVPEQQFSNAIARLGPGAVRHLQRDNRYLVTFVDSENFGAPVGVGVFLDLEGHGRQVRVERQYSRRFGSWRVASRPQVDGVVIVVAGGDIERGWVPPPGATRIAAYDPLSRPDRARAQLLERQARQRLGPAAPVNALPVLNPITRKLLIDSGVDPHAVEELRQLRQRGDAYYAYLAHP
jgi:hypothetical protein